LKDDLNHRRNVLILLHNYLNWKSTFSTNIVKKPISKNEQLNDDCNNDNQI
jgi:hypothetical protein